jgi:hypothetical protein
MVISLQGLSIESLEEQIAIGNNMEIEVHMDDDTLVLVEVKRERMKGETKKERINQESVKDVEEMEKKRESDMGGGKGVENMIVNAEEKGEGEDINADRNMLFKSEEWIEDENDVKKNRRDKNGKINAEEDKDVMIIGIQKMKMMMRRNVDGELKIDIEAVMFGKNGNFQMEKRKSEKRPKPSLALSLSPLSSFSSYFLRSIYVDMSMTIAPMMSLISPEARQMNAFPMKKMHLRSLKVINDENNEDKEDNGGLCLEETGFDALRCKGSGNDGVLLDVCLLPFEMEAVDKFAYKMMNVIMNMTLLLGESSGNAKRKMRIKMKEVDGKIKSIRNGIYSSKNDGEERNKCWKILIPNSLQLASHSVIGDVEDIISTIHRPMIMGEIQRETKEDNNEDDKVEKEKTNDDMNKSVENLFLPSSSCSREDGSEICITMSSALLEGLKFQKEMIEMERDVLMNMLWGVIDEKEQMLEKMEYL